MATDFSRVRLDPLRDYAGVELKQGGVLLDADANELVAIFDRRFRALASDTLGRATVSSTTPEAFRIGFANGELQIGKGRMYVDGLLAENHGARATTPGMRGFDGLLAEETFTADAGYETQPHPQPPDTDPDFQAGTRLLAAALPGTGRHLVYLDAWNREVTHLEQPGLIENAVAVETSSRMQTVWRVRVLELDPGTGDSLTCGTPDEDIPGWADLIAPSTGVLTSGTFDVAQAEDPCELPPTGRYRGLENQLYRVEIHDPGQPGGNATFKWSRENASVGSRVASMLSDRILELETLGRDSVLRFDEGDWVEIVDDLDEFSRGHGEMRRIASVDDATRRITFDQPLTHALPAGYPDNDFPRERNLRVRRWDQKRQVHRTGQNGATVQVQDLDAAGSTGVIKVPTASTRLLLENGVTVQFDSTGTKGFRSGDYWVFVARTSDASVELLDRAPPRGIHHHYARLAIVDFGNGLVVSDCRSHWPPPSGGGENCACTVCVSPEQHKNGSPSLQMAIDYAIERGGGTVCLDVGQYDLDKPLHVRPLGNPPPNNFILPADSLRIVGKGAATVLHSMQAVFDAIEDSRNVHLERLTLVARQGPTLIVRDAAQIVLDRLSISNSTQNPGIGLSGALAGIVVRRCSFATHVGIATIGKDEPTGLFDIRIEDNELGCWARGVQIDSDSIHLGTTRIAGNRFSDCYEVAVEVGGTVLPESGHIDISGNAFHVLGDAIVAGTPNLDVAHNEIRLYKASGKGRGVALVASGFGDRTVSIGALEPGNCRIVHNHIDGFGVGVSLETALASAAIRSNHIERCSFGIRAEKSLGLQDLVIENNLLVRMGEAAVSVDAMPVSDIPSRISVCGNHFSAEGRQEAIVVRHPDSSIVFTDNHGYSASPAGPVVSLECITLIVTSNRIEGVEREISIRHICRTYTAVGNITRGVITPLDPPWKPLNVTYP